MQSKQRLNDGAGVLPAQAEFNYDEYAPLTHLTTIAQHDTTNYSGAFYWRGNATSTLRYSVSFVITPLFCDVPSAAGAPGNSNWREPVGGKR